MVYSKKKIYRSDFVANANQQQPTLCTINCNLADQLVKTLRIKLFPNGADARLTSLALLQPFI